MVVSSCCCYRRDARIVLSRRKQLAGFTAALGVHSGFMRQLLSSSLSSAAVAAELESSTSPYVQRAEDGVDALGRLRGCTTLGNCVSTSSRGPETYSAAWVAPDLEPETVARQIAAALETSFGNAVDVGVEKMTMTPAQSSSMTMRGGDGEKTSQSSPPPSVYVRARVPGLYGEDTLEFLVSSETLDRNWSGDRPGAIITYTSRGAVQFLYPLQRPLGDFNMQRRRLEKLRETLGYRLVGCELLECYQ